MFYLPLEKNMCLLEGADIFELQSIYGDGMLVVLVPTLFPHYYFLYAFNYIYSTYNYLQPRYMPATANPQSSSAKLLIRNTSQRKRI